MEKEREKKSILCSNLRLVYEALIYWATSVWGLKLLVSSAHALVRLSYLVQSETSCWIHREVCIFLSLKNEKTAKIGEITRFEKSSSQDTEYFVRVVKDKRTGKNGLEFLIGWRDYAHSKYDTCEHITYQVTNSSFPITDGGVAKNRWKEN